MTNTYKVQINTANGQPFINLPKKEGWKSGDELKLSLEWGTVYNEGQLKNYYNENKGRLLELQNKLSKLNKSIFESNEYKFILGELPEIFELGELDGGCDEPYYFENSEFDFYPQGDVDGGIYGDITYSLTQFLEGREKGKYELDKPENFNKELLDNAKIKFIQKIMEYYWNKYDLKFNEICEEYGFKITDKKMDSFNSVYTDDRVWLRFFEGRYYAMSIIAYDNNDIAIEVEE